MSDKRAVLGDKEHSTHCLKNWRGDTACPRSHIFNYVRYDYSYKQWLLLCQHGEKQTIGPFLKVSVGRTYKLVNKGTEIILVFFAKIIL